MQAGTFQIFSTIKWRDTCSITVRKHSQFDAAKPSNWQRNKWFETLKRGLVIANWSRYLWHNAVEKVPPWMKHNWECTLAKCRCSCWIQGPNWQQLFWGGGGGVLLQLQYQIWPQAYILLHPPAIEQELNWPLRRLSSRHHVRSV